MIALALGLLLASAPPSEPSLREMEAQAARHVLREFERVGRRAPTRDEGLTRAARRLAQDLLSQQDAPTPDHSALTSAVSDAGEADPTPFSVVIRSWVPRHTVETLLTRRDFSQQPASHFGVGVASQGQRTTLVLLLAERKATLRDFPRTLPQPGQARQLCGELAPGLGSAQVLVTLPDGSVERMKLTQDKGPRFCARLRFEAAGPYTVEVVAKGRAGPEVASLFLVDVGPSRRPREREPQREPDSVPEARQRILARINALRRAHGLGELVPDATLEAVAQAYSERMAREGFFAHVAPDGSTLRQRLPADGPAYSTAGENLGLAAGPLAAHFGIEHSPGHRKNLLEPRFQHAGIGIAFQTVEGNRQALLTEVFTVAPPGPSAPGATALDEAYRTLAQHRSGRKLPPLRRSEVLEQLAHTLARRALELDKPSARQPDFPVHERVFAALPGARTATVDFYVVSDPHSLPDSRALGEPTNNQVGIGLIRGDSPTFGRNQYWVAVVYAELR